MKLARSAASDRIRNAIVLMTDSIAIYLEIKGESALFEVEEVHSDPCFTVLPSHRWPELLDRRHQDLLVVVVADALRVNFPATVAVIESDDVMP